MFVFNEIFLNSFLFLMIAYLRFRAIKDSRKSENMQQRIRDLKKKFSDKMYTKISCSLMQVHIIVPFITNQDGTFPDGPYLHYSVLLIHELLTTRKNEIKVFFFVLN
jgi:hypothetical protein